MRRMGLCPCKQPGRPIARFHSNPSGKCLAGRSAALRRLLIAELSTAHRALHPIPARYLCDPEKTLNRFFPHRDGGRVVRHAVARAYALQRRHLAMAHLHVARARRGAAPAGVLAQATAIQLRRVAAAEGAADRGMSQRAGSASGQRGCCSRASVMKKAPGQRSNRWCGPAADTAVSVPLEHPCQHRTGSQNLFKIFSR